MKKVKIISAIILLTFSVISNAQKLPDVQQTGIVANSPIKVDGKLTEPGLNFQAFNKNTGLYYTLMNDDKNLYLIMKAEETDNIRKILMGGITLTFNSSGKKKTKDASAITYPVIAPPTRGPMQGRQGTFEHRIEKPIKEKNKPDSAAITAMRKKLSSFNEIKISGINIPDTILSIYNQYDIKTAINYDHIGNLIYEFSIPLNLLNIDINRSKEFSYNIKINGLPLPGPPPISTNNEVGGPRNGSAGPGPGMGERVLVMNGSSFDPSMLEPTDFWGKYTLVKK